MKLKRSHQRNGRLEAKLNAYLRRPLDVATLGERYLGSCEEAPILSEVEGDGAMSITASGAAGTILFGDATLRTSF